MSNRLIKKYPNRRLYDTRTSTYITLADVKQLVLDSEVFQVVDAKSGEDLTRSILLQIILEEEAGGAPMFSSDLLAQMIRFYGHAMQGVVGKMLEGNLRSFLDMQESLKEQARGLYGENAGGVDVWAQMMKMPAAAGMQNLMTTYLDQSRKIAEQLQDQMKQQANSAFGGFAARNPTKE